jgi:site-specific recombinase XerD
LDSGSDPSAEERNRIGDRFPAELKFLLPSVEPDKIHSDGIERISYPRREWKLPIILSRDEVRALLEAPSDLRHRAMLAILYGSGLRVSEVARIKVADIDTARNVLWVRSGKGRKDRHL